MTPEQTAIIMAFESKSKEEQETIRNAFYLERRRAPSIRETIRRLETERKNSTNEFTQRRLEKEIGRKKGELRRIEQEQNQENFFENFFKKLLGMD